MNAPHALRGKAAHGPKIISISPLVFMLIVMLLIAARAAPGTAQGDEGRTAPCWSGGWATPARMEATSTSVAIPEVPGFPTSSAPLGLGTVALPADAHAIAILFAHLPAEVAGQPRAPLPDRPVDELIVAYGPDPGTGPSLSLAAMNLTGDPFDEFPIELTVAGFLSSAVDPAFDYGAVAFGQDGALLWVCAEHVLTDASGTSLVRYSLAWGDAASPWLFGVSADSPAGLAALVTVFVETAEGEPWRHETPASGSPGAGSLCRLHEVPFVHGVTDRAASIAYWRGAAS